MHGVLAPMTDQNGKYANSGWQQAGAKHVAPLFVMDGETLMAVASYSRRQHTVLSITEDACQSACGVRGCQYAPEESSQECEGPETSLIPRIRPTDRYFQRLSGPHQINVRCSQDRHDGSGFLMHSSRRSGCLTDVTYWSTKGQRKRLRIQPEAPH